MKFAIIGAHKETGNDVNVVLVATSKHEAELAATHQGILVSSIKLLMEEKDTSALSMDDDGPAVVEQGEGDSEAFWKQAAGGSAKKEANGHGTIVLGANSPSDSTHV